MIYIFDSGKSVMKAMFNLDRNKKDYFLDSKDKNN